MCNVSLIQTHLSEMGGAKYDSRHCAAGHAGEETRLWSLAGRGLVCVFAQSGEFVAHGDVISAMQFTADRVAASSQHRRMAVLVCGSDAKFCETSLCGFLPSEWSMTSELGSLRHSHVRVSDLN
jgi:hypothetical protein